jgi:mRNA-degrading endonuclease toxin of MazEF toxin-antitoxin module
MASFEQGDVIKVPFPYTDRAARQFRPALVVSSRRLEAAHDLVWVLMITSASNRGLRGDVSITSLSTAGLPAPSIVRTAKIATIEAKDAAKLGRISASALKRVLDEVATSIESRRDQRLS